MRRTTRSQMLLFLLAILAAALLVAGCGGDSSKDAGGNDGSDESSVEEVDQSASSEPAAEVSARDGKYDSPPDLKLDPAKSYVVAVDTTMGGFNIAVDPKRAPIAAANFVFLVEEGYYDGVPFHRIIKDFMVQTGDPTGTGMGGPGYELKDDPVTGKYVRGTVAMANAGPDTGGSQFFIIHGPAGEALPPQYVPFGLVDAAGMKTIDKIANVEVTTSPSGEPSQPVEPVTITSAKLVG